MRMPVMDGWAVARADRARPGPHAPIVVVTAARDAAARAAQVGALG
jgi:CheY-like chemotaxis protein